MALLGDICIIGQYRTDRIQEELQVVLLKDLQVQCYSELRFWEDCGYPLLDESFWIFGLKNSLVSIGYVPLPSTSAADFRVGCWFDFCYRVSSFSSLCSQWCCGEVRQGRLNLGGSMPSTPILVHVPGCGSVWLRKDSSPPSDPKCPCCLLFFRRMFSLTSNLSSVTHHCKTSVVATFQ